MNRDTARDVVRNTAGDVIRIELPTPYEVGPVNVYVMMGERPTLVDVGPGTEAAESALLRGLANVGLSMQDIDQIVITHTHVDHHGLLERVLEVNPNARVFAHVLAEVGFGQDVERRLAFYDELFARSGMPTALRKAATAGLRHMLALEPKTSVDEWLHDGDLLAAGDGTWRVLHTPGHSSNLVSLYREATQTLITSDHLLPGVSSNAIVEPPPIGANQRNHSLIQYVDALRKVASLPVQVALPGHGEPFANVAELVDERLAMHERRLVDIESRLGAVRRGGGRRRSASDPRAGAKTIAEGTHGLDATAATFAKEGATVFQLASHMFNIQDGDTLTLAMSEVQGHLDILEARERVVPEERGGVTVYRLRR